jgi:hypothetical protein
MFPVRSEAGHGSTNNVFEFSTRWKLEDGKSGGRKDTTVPGSASG